MDIKDTKKSNKVKFLSISGEVKEKNAETGDIDISENNLKTKLVKNKPLLFNKSVIVNSKLNLQNNIKDEGNAHVYKGGNFLTASLNTWLSKKPIRLVLLSFLLVIFVGACLLSMPFSSSSGHSNGFFVSLFTATSATCVTGLVLLDTMTAWSFCGQVIILSLIQIGGLSLLTILSALSMGFKHKLTFRTTRALTDGTGSSGLDETLKLVTNIIFITLAIELTGAIILSIRFMQYMSVNQAIWKGIFQSISSFCNAGFDLMGNYSGKFSSLIAFRNDPIILLTTSLLIISGGLGFIVWTDLINFFRKKHFRFHSKIVLFTTLFLLISGTLFFFFAENMVPNNEWINMSFSEKLLNSFFQSTTARTAGFNSISQNNLSEASKWFTSILMLIGAGPASTGGGIKVTTFIIFIVASISDLKGKSDEIHLFKHRIDQQLARRSFSLLTFSIVLTFALSFLIFFSMPKYLHNEINFSDVFFESSSAFATVGLSSISTNRLNFLSHVGLIIAMYIGRVGPASLSLSIIISKSKKATKIYPEGKTLVG